MKIFVTMGTSLRLSRCWRNPDGRWPFEPDEAIGAASLDSILNSNPSHYCSLRQNVEDITKHIEQRMGGDSDGYDQAAKIAVENSFITDCWTKNGWHVLLPAELATLKIMSQRGAGGTQDHRRLLTEDDAVTFVAGASQQIMGNDYGGTEREAYICKHVLCKCMPDISERVTVHVLRSNWVPANAAIFSNTSREFWNHVDGGDHAGVHVDRCIVLTGGYKGIAIDIARKYHERHAPRLIYMHESSGNELIEWGDDGEVYTYLL